MKHEEDHPVFIETPSKLALLPTLKLLQLADSALPVGANAHSWGLETLVQEGLITSASVESFLLDYVLECGRLEGRYCGAGYLLDRSPTTADSWLGRCLSLHRQLSAFKPSREGRVASATLGRRLLTLALNLEDQADLRSLLQNAEQSGVELHYALIFGMVGKLWDCDLTLVIGALLHQMLVGALSACQRLLLLGQTQVSQITWRLKIPLSELAETLTDECLRTASGGDPCAVPSDLHCFAPQIDLAGMRHPWLDARMFIS